LPKLHDLTWPLSAWVLVRATLDAIGVACLYLAVGIVLGRGPAVLAALLYATSIGAWTSARDPAGSLAPVLFAIGLLAAARIVRQPSALNGLFLGAALAAIVRELPPAWGIVVAGALTLSLARASWLTGSLAGSVLVIGAGPALWARPSTAWMAASEAFGQWRLPVLLIALPPDGSAPGGLAIGTLGVVATSVLLALTVLGIVSAIALVRQARPDVLLLPIWALGAVVSSASAHEPTALPASTILLAALAALPVASSGRVVVRWGIAVAAGLLIASGAAAIALNLVSIERTASQRAAFDLSDASTQRACGVAGLSCLEEPSAASASLRDWQSLADGVQDAAERSHTADLIVADGDERISSILGSLPGARIAIRRLAPDIGVLPLTGETLFILRRDAPRPAELARPSSLVGVATPSGTDTGARLATLRARPAVDWLSRTESVPAARFDDGSVLLGVLTRRDEPDRVTVTLFWQLAPPGQVASPPARWSRTSLDGDRLGHQQTLALPSTSDWRPDELILQRLPAFPTATAGTAPAFVVELLDANGRTITTQDGAQQVRVPGPPPDAS